MISDTKARTKPDDLDKFDWDLTDRDQHQDDDLFLLFDERVASYERKREGHSRTRPRKATLEQGPGHLHLCDVRTWQSPARHI